MKTKPFLLATAGSTVDGRTIDDKMLTEMASSYNPKTYGARLNIEHIRGMTGEKPFKAFGDVLELSTANVEIDFNGTKETRLGLYGVFDVTDDAKALNEAGQKVYPSIEIESNFGGKGHAYLMGCALTDSPASIGTERLQFNRALPGVITLTAEASNTPAALLAPADDVAANDAAVSVVAGFFSKLSDKLGLNGQQAPAAPAVTVPAAPAAGAPAFDPAQFAKDLGEALEQAFAKQAEGVSAQIATVTSQVTALSQKIENTADPIHKNRPPANGPNGNFTRTDC